MRPGQDRGIGWVCFSSRAVQPGGSSAFIALGCLICQRVYNPGCGWVLGVQLIGKVFTGFCDQPENERAVQEKVADEDQKHHRQR
jgi:hypothetical protein